MLSGTEGISTEHSVGDYFNAIINIINNIKTGNI